MELFTKDEEIITLKNIKKIASRRGKRDGKAEKPSLSWGVNSVPFISQAHAQFSAEAERRIANTRETLNARVYSSLDRDEQISFQSSRYEALAIELAEADEREKYFKNEIDGYKAENPVGRFARTKLIGDLVYPVVLFILAVGEIFVTLPALVKLFGSGKIESNVIGVAVGILPVAGAHIIGIFLKSRLDRQRPQESWVSKLYLIISALLVGAIIALGILRAGITEGALQDFAIIGKDHTKLYLIFFFIFLQLAFFAVAIGLSFMHYSPAASAYKSARVHSKKLKEENGKIANSLMSQKSKSSISSDEVDAQIRSLSSEVEILRKEYEISVSIYREANIHSRRDEINGSHPALQAPLMEIDLNKFLDVYTAIGSPQSKLITKEL